MQRGLKRIVVLGGGPVGWLAATYLNRALNRFRPGAVEVIVLECDRAPASEPAAPGSALLSKTLQWLGIAEPAFLLRTEATFMHGSRFVNWLDDPRLRQSTYDHPLDRIAAADGVELGQIWVADRGLSPHSRFDYAVSIQPTLCDRSTCPKLASSRPFEALVEYSYQVDPRLLSDYLRGLAISRGVQAVAGRIARFTRSDDGDLDAAHTSDGRSFGADFFIDCEGSAVRELDADRRDAIVSYDRSLLCDRILTIDLGPAVDGTMRPYFNVRAAAAGWIGESDLAARRRLTYVYSSGFCSELAAERELRAYAHAADEVPMPCSLASFEPGRRKAFWQRNCLAMGSAAGSIEPLVATAVGHAEAAIEIFVAHLPLAEPYDTLRARCNRELGALYDAARDLSVAHYCLTRRDDTAFWRANRHDIHVPDALRQDLELWAHRLPNPSERSVHGRWCDHAAFQFVLAGMERLGSVRSPYDGYVNPELASATFRQLEKMRAQAVAIAPDHGRYIRGLRVQQIELDLLS